MKKIYFLLIAVILFATSCKKNLSKHNAIKQIAAFQHYPKTENYTFPKKFTKDYNTEGRGVTIMLDDDEGWDEKLRMIEAFRKKELIQFEETPHREETTAWLMGTTVRSWTEVKASIAEAGRKYLVSEDDNSIVVKLWETGIDPDIEIQKTGKEAKYAIVTFKPMNNNITPFGEFFEGKDKKEPMTRTFARKGQK